ncbi:MAG TPA: hypothetical protein VFQ05_16520 [Candidatus Eisenbacteria bacterium]|nr:hypothetical protein [Candidatus Eisenbacteria bacterium]
MILRIAAAFSLALGSSLLFAFFAWIGESPISGEPERHLRQMKERATAPATYARATFSDFVALPHGMPVSKFAPLERRSVSLEGYVKAMTLSSDGDYHLSLAPAPPPPIHVSSPTISCEVTPQWIQGSRWWQWEPLQAALKPHSWFEPAWPGGPRQVRLSGYLLYDFQYDEPYFKDRRLRLPSPPPHRLTGWEIHPVTRIELWDDSLGAYVEYTR